MGLARWPGGRVRLVAVPGGALPVEEAGEGAAVLMLHGWTLDRRMWRPQLALARDVRLIGMDRRGFGQASAPADMGAEPDDVLRVADALGLEHFHLLGMSQGGKLALACAARLGARVRSVMVAGTALDGVTAADEGVPLAAMTAAARAGRLDEMRQLWAGHGLVRLAGEAGAALLAEMLDDYDGRDLARGPGRLDVRAGVMGRIVAPVLALVGDRDTPRRQANVAALEARGAKAVVLADAGHLANIERAAAFNAAAAAWWRAAA